MPDACVSTNREQLRAHTPGVEVQLEQGHGLGKATVRVTLTGIIFVSSGLCVTLQWIKISIISNTS
jgi:hypothetical protein